MSDGHTTAEKNDYTVTFHPAFASSCSVEGTDGSKCVVYEQKGVHHLNGGEHPKRHTLRLEGGQYGRDITLDVHDPKHHIAGITVHMYGEGHVPGAKSGTGTVETFSVVNDVITCPPICVEPPPDGGGD